MLARHKVLPLTAAVLFCLVGFVIWRSNPGSSQLERTRRQKTPVVRSNSTKVVLVTGAAGFIGFHLATELNRINKTVVVGLDNFNDYYDVELKKDRAFLLHTHGVTIYHEDLCHTEFLEDLFTRYKFTHVVHLAAQAGVRYSLQNPLAYIRANVECQVALLEVMRKYPHIKLVYASSSSVYGKHTPVPFKLTARTDRPGNMYAATKETDELLGNYYCQAYQMSAVGLRFFTVYGPWGRPDMATYKFAEAMVSKNEVPMFHVSDDKPLERDFTYVDDIVKGIMAAMDYVPAECGEKFNLGFGQPLSVPQLISILEKELRVKGNIKKLPLPPTEILKTWADTSVSKELLHFQPTTNLQEGTKKFVEWFKKYKRDYIIRSHNPFKKMWYSSLIKERDNRDALYENKKILKHNEALQSRLSQERQRYAEWAHSQGLHIPVICDVKFVVDNATGSFRQTCPCKPGYQSQGRDCIPIYNELNRAMVEQEFQKEAIVNSDLKKGREMIQFKKLTSDGADYMYAPKMSTPQLIEACKRDRLCMAVTTTGWMKWQVTSKEHWKKSSHGIIVFDVDYCSLSDIKCREHSKCTRMGPADYQCVCEPPFVFNKQHRCEKAPETVVKQKVTPISAKDKQKANNDKDIAAPDNQKAKPVAFSIQKAKTGNDNVAPDNQKAKTVNDNVAPDSQKAKTVNDNAAPDNQKAKTVNDKVAPDNQKAKTVNDKVAPINQKAKTGNDNVAPINQKAKTVNDKVAPDNQKAKTVIDNVVLDNQKAKTDKDEVPPETLKMQSVKKS